MVGCGGWGGGAAHTRARRCPHAGAVQPRNQGRVVHVHPAEATEKLLRSGHHLVVLIARPR